MRAPILFCLGLLALPAQADFYKWTDAEGRVHFSDTAPKEGKAEVLKAPAAATAPGEKAAGSSAEVQQRQKEMLRVMDEDRAERAALKQKTDAEAAQKAERCNKLQSRRSNLYGRVYTRNDKGEKAYLTDAELLRAQQETDAALRQQGCQ